MTTQELADALAEGGWYVQVFNCGMPYDLAPPGQKWDCRVAMSGRGQCGGMGATIDEAMAQALLAKKELLGWPPPPRS